MPRRTKPRDPTAVPRVLLLLAVFLCPVIFDRGAFKPFDVPKVSVVGILAVLASGLWVVELIRGRVSFVRFRIGTAAAGFLAIAGLATLFSLTRLVSLVGSYGRYQGLVQFAIYVAIFVLFVQLYWQRPERTKEIVFAIAGASILVVAYIIVQRLGLDPFRWERLGGGKVRFNRVGSLGNANFAGGFLGMTLPWFVFALLRARRTWLKAVVVAGGVLALFAMSFTGSRGGYIAGLAGGIAAAYLFSDRLPRPRLVRKLAAVAVAALLVVLIAAFAYAPAQEGPLRSESLRSRLVWWKATVGHIVDRPLLGAGPDSYVVTYPQYAPEREFTEYPDKPHNILLSHAAEMGLLGLGAYLSLIFLAGRWGVRRMRSATRSERDLLGTFMAMFAAYLAQGFFSIDMPVLATSSWAILAGLVTLADPTLVDLRMRRTESGRHRRMTWPRRAGILATLVITAFFTTAVIRPWLADRVVHDAVTGHGAEALTTVQGNYDRAIGLHPYNPIYLGMAGDYLRRLSIDTEQPLDRPTKKVLLEEAVDYFKKMDEMQPNYHLWKMSVAEAVSYLADVSEDETLFEEAEFWFEDANELGPADWRVHLRFGDMYRAWGRLTRDSAKFCDAVDEFEKGISLRDDRIGGWIGLGASYAALGRLREAGEAADRALELNAGAATAQRLVAQLKDLRKKDLRRIECT